MNYDFESIDHKFFEEKFLISEKVNIRNSSKGELSKLLSKANIEAADRLNKWASVLKSDIQKFINRNKYQSIEIKIIKAEDYVASPASALIITYGNYDIKTFIYDNDRILIDMPQKYANIVNKGNKKKILNNLNKTSKYLMALIELVVNHENTE